MSKYNPKTVLRQTSNSLIRELFLTCSSPPDLPWNELGEREIRPIFEAMQTLPERERRRLDVVLQQLHLMASGEHGLRVLLRETAAERFTEILKNIDSRYDRALFLHLQMPEAWNEAVRFVEADQLPQRFWVRRHCPTGCVADTSETGLARLEKRLSEFFVAEEGRGHFAKAEHFTRGEQEYFFVRLSDYTHRYRVWNEDRTLVPCCEKPSFPLVFVFDRRSLETYAQGGRAIREAVQAIFAEEILQKTLPEMSPGGTIYRLDPLKYSNFRTPTDPEDGIERVHLKAMTIAIPNHCNEVITITATEGESIHDLMMADLNLRLYGFEDIVVLQVKLHFSLTGRGRTRSLTFEVRRNACTLAGKSESMQRLGEKYLRRWGILPEIYRFTAPAREVQHAG